MKLQWIKDLLGDSYTGEPDSMMRPRVRIPGAFRKLRW